MQSLTHQERESLKKSVRAFQSECNLDDSHLIREISSLLTSNSSGTGLERVFYHSTLDLINFLRNSPDIEGSSLIRGTLCHILSSYKNLESRPWLLVIQEMSFVASFAVSEIKETNNISFAAEHLVLDEKEKQAAEEILLEFMDEPGVLDTELCSHAIEVIKNNSQHRTAGIISRFQDNLRFLCDVLKNDGWNEEQKNWARGALKYVHVEDDLIPDDLGIIGLLDDVYVVQTALDLILPDRPPWIELISELQMAWPFLRDIIFEYQNQEYSFSDFSLVNSALICPELRNNEKDFKTTLILPSAGTVPFYISLCAVFGTIYSSVKIKRDDIGLVIDQKVLVDNTAVAIFDGLDQLGNETFIRLKQFNVRKGKKLETINRIPIHEAPRICIASDDLKTHGKISTRLHTTDTPLSAIERLLHLQYPLQFSNIKGRVWLISVSSHVNKLMKEISIYGQKLIDIFPVGHIKRDGTSEVWGRKFGETAPLLTVISDMDLAADFIEDQEVNKDDYIIIDMTGVNSSRISAFEILQSFDARILCVIEEKNASLISNQHYSDFDSWEWAPDQARKLLSKSIREGKLSTHPFNENDVKASRCYSLNTNETILVFTAAQISFNHIDELSHYIRNRKDEVSYDLDKVYDILIGSFLSLTRNTFSVLESISLFKDVSIKLDESTVLLEGSVFLSENEQELIRASIVGLRSLVDEMEADNPKSSHLELMLDDNSDAKILFSDPRKNIPLNEECISQADKYVTISDLGTMDIQELIIPFWPGKDRVWQLISRPTVKSLHYVLYEFENKWKRNFENKRNYQRVSRHKSTDNSSIFPTVRNWPIQKEAINGSQPVHENVKSNDLIELRNQRRANRFIGEVSDTVEAADTQVKLVVFQGWGCAFLTDTYQAHVVTHLFTDEFNKDNNATVKTKLVKDLISGDILVFLRGTSKDAIKDLADSNMPEGTREVATLWQKALRKLIYSGLTDFKHLHDDLEREGCKRHIVTIKHWFESGDVIGPRDAKNGALVAIAKVTGDKELKTRINECNEAISLVWSEHLSAASTIAKKVLAEINTRIIDNFDLDEPLEIGDGMILVSVDYINNKLIYVPKSKSNRLLESS
jgi:uncharacterized membrane protein YkvA (DUF1232 family)